MGGTVGETGEHGCMQCCIRLMWSACVRVRARRSAYFDYFTLRCLTAVVVFPLSGSVWGGGGNENRRRWSALLLCRVASLSLGGTVLGGLCTRCCVHFRSAAYGGGACLRGGPRRLFVLLWGERRCGGAGVAGIFSLHGRPLPRLAMMGEGWAEVGGYVSFTRTSTSPLCWERRRCLVRRRIASELHGLRFTLVVTGWGFRNGSVALDVVVPLRMIDHLGGGGWTNDVDTVAPEEQLVVKRMEKDGGGVELPQDEVLKRLHPAKRDVSLSGGKETLPQADYCLLHGATLDAVHGDSVRQLHGKLLAQDGVGGAAYFDALSEAGNGILLGGVASLATTMQLGCMDVTTASVPFTQPPSMFKLRRRITRAPTLSTSASGSRSRYLRTVSLSASVRGWPWWSVSTAS